MTDRLDDGVRRRGARDGGDDARRGGRHHNLYARENTRARARVVGHAFALARARAARARPHRVVESSSRDSSSVIHPYPSPHRVGPIDASRARASDASVVDRAFARARMSSDVFLARRLVLLLVVVARPSSVDVDRVLARALARRARARVRGTNERTNDDDRTIERSIERARPAGHYFSPRIHAAFDASLASARAPSRHPSIHSRARDRSDPGADRIEIARTFCSLVVSAARATTMRPARRLEFAVALTARVSRACVIARVVANIVGVCRARARRAGEQGAVGRRA